MKKLIESDLARANKALQSKEYVAAIRLYEEVIQNADGNLLQQIRFNLEFAKRRLDLIGVKHEPEISNFKESEALSEAISGQRQRGTGKGDVGVLMFHDLCDEDKVKYSYIKSFGIDMKNYFHVNSHNFISEDPIVDYLLVSKEELVKIPKVFDAEFYRDSYPDVANSGLDLFVHFLEHGRREGRVGIFDSSKIIAGEAKFNPALETILIVSHESSATGAPLLGLNLARSLSKKYNICHFILRSKQINEAFKSSSFSLYCDPLDNIATNFKFYAKHIQELSSIRCCLFNSIATFPALNGAVMLDLPTVFLIHEFSEYTKPAGTMLNAVVYSDIVVVPEDVLLRSLLNEFKTIQAYVHEPSNIRVLQQGKLPYIPDSYGSEKSSAELLKDFNIINISDVKVIVGAGFVQHRKGVDIFIIICQYIKKLYAGECRFLWVGDGYDENDLSYSVYLKNQISNSGLSDEFFFVPHQKNLSNVFDIADVFVLSSRLDPFPNVLIDALAHDLHVACFKDTTGCAGFLDRHKANATIVPSFDVYSMSQGVANYLSSTRHKNNINSSIAKCNLNFDEYVSRIETFVDEACCLRSTILKIANELYERAAVDTDFYTVSSWVGDRKNKYKLYTSNSLKGIHSRNPRPGFSDAKWLIDNDMCVDASIVPIYESLHDDELKTHENVMVPCAGINVVNFRYAVHLHLFYVDLADYFISYFECLPGNFDLYITVVDKSVMGVVSELFDRCGAKRVHVVYVNNLGRDIAPFLEILNQIRENNQYQVIGHFHSKKSLDKSSTMGDDWRDFLLNTLIGDTKTANSVLSIFNDPKIGLVFPDDPNFVGITKNSFELNELCDFLGLTNVEETPVFPVGNMFWMRSDIAFELTNLNKNLFLIDEPIPNDGTYLHAVERITPHLCEQLGFKFITVSRVAFYRD